VVLHIHDFWPAHSLGWVVRLARHPRLIRILLQFNPAVADWALAGWVREWRSGGLPHYRAAVRYAEEQVDRLSADELAQLVEQVGAAAGDYFVWIALVAGAGYKTEAPLARFYRRHLFPTLGGSHQQFLAGLTDPALRIAPHAVHSLDWCQPTLGELDTARISEPRSAVDRPAAVAEARDGAVAAARSVLAHQPRQSLRKQFEPVLATAQRYARLREDIVSQFTLGWPVLRRAVLRLGEELMQADVVDRPEDIFFLTRAEVLTMVPPSTSGSLRAQVSERRQTWNKQRALTPPLVLGQIPRALMQGIGQLEAALAPRCAAPDAILHGLPASPGQATGPVRIIRTPAEFDRLQVGDVLVAPATTPAWTPLFARAAAVITDTGGVLAHASLVAREYGIPSVVATRDATVRLCEGQSVQVDGLTGVISVYSASTR
jgi:pyruvate,water dikinase